MSEENSTQTLYRFLDPVGARITLETGTLRVGRLAEFNDPFDFSFGFDRTPMLSEGIKAKTVRDYLARMNARFGVLCFCEGWTDPVIWGHYTEKHHGAALEFRLKPTENLWKVNYSPARPLWPAEGNATPLDGFATLREAGKTKAPSWAYEQESRLVIALDDCRANGGHYLLTFPEEEILLTKIILGFRSPLEEAYIRNAIAGKPYENVPVCRTTMSISEYKMEIK